MAIVDDFKDIASRMKGELKVQPKPVPEPPKPLRNWRDMVLQPAICYNCHGGGLDAFGNCCERCCGTGLEP